MKLEASKKRRIAITVVIVGGLVWIAELIYLCRVALEFKASLWP